MSKISNSSLIIAGIFSGFVGVILTAVSRVANGEQIIDADTVVLSQYILTSMTTSIIGPAVIFIHRLQIQANEMEYGVLSMNWPKSNAQLTKIGPVRAKIAYSLRNLIEGIASKDADARSEIVANEIVHWTLHEQEANVRDFGRIQLISQTPGLSQDAQAKDTYQLITEFAENGDVIYATAFTNTRLWWLRPQTGEKFLNFNLDLIRRGLSINRIFGVNHPDWPSFDLAEDELGAKKELIQLHANIIGTETYTIEYNSFKDPIIRSRYNIDLRDCMLLVRNGKPYFGLEWAVDLFGEADKVYVVFGQSQLNSLYENLQSILRVDEGHGLIQIPKKIPFDTSTEDGRRDAMRHLQSILG
tara:strand:- start:241 stop:1314 length:1074 start_codon:yes stop_codon:yes gene_type:complete